MADSRQANLQAAKNKKDDEFYTQFEDVENEMIHYAGYLYNKIIYCPCDDYRQSNFVKFFKENFIVFGLRKLFATNYDNGDGAFIYEYDGRNEFVFKVVGQDGGYRCYDRVRDEADIIITNPPFSLWRDFFKWVQGKDFILMAPLNCVKYKTVWPHVRDRRIRLGYEKRGSGHTLFNTPCGNVKDMSNIVWLTTFPSLEREPLELTERYSPEKYPFFDNYSDIINCNYTKDIPCDFYGKIGVPISFLNYWCPEQFDIIQLINSGALLDGKAKYSRLVIKRRFNIKE